MSSGAIAGLVVLGAAVLVFGALVFLDEMGFINGRLAVRLNRCAGIVVLPTAFAFPTSYFLGVEWFVDRKVANLQPTIDRMIEQFIPTTTRTAP